MRAEFEDVLRFWLDRGVDGFRIDVAHGMVKDARACPTGTARAMIEAVESSPRHRLRTDRNRARCSTRTACTTSTAPGASRRVRHGDRALVAEAWVEPLSRLTRYVRPDEMHQAFNFAFLATHWDAPALRTVVEASYRASDAVGAPTTWVLSNHDVVRHASRLGLRPGSRPHGIGHGARAARRGPRACGARAARRC